MIQGLIAKKIGMSQQFDDAGNVIPVTILKAGPCTVIQKKTAEKDGYVGRPAGLRRGAGRPQAASSPRSGTSRRRAFPSSRSSRSSAAPTPPPSRKATRSSSTSSRSARPIHVVGTSKGKGFAGVVKRHHFAGGDAAHGSMFHRAPGSIGASSYPSRVVKGMRMGGHMGHERVTVRKLKVVATDKDNNLLVVKGAVPGAKGGYVLIKKGLVRSAARAK